jgi:hypothetical protein
MYRNTAFTNLMEERFPIETKWKPLARTAVSWFALIGLCYFLAGSIVSSSDVPILFFWSALFFIVALNNQFHGFVIAMVLAFYSSYLVYLFSLGSVYLMLPYILVLSLFARRFADTLLHIKLVRSPLNKTVLLLSIFILISLGLGNNGLAVGLKGIIKHLTFPILFLVVVNSNLTESSLKKMIAGILVIAFAQIPASIIQYFFIYVDWPSGARFDRSAGLLGFSSGDINAVFMTFILSILFGLIINKGFRFKYLLGAVALLIPIILSSARAGILFFVITAAFMATLVLFRQKRERRYKVSVALGGIVVIMAGSFLMARSNQLSFIMNPAAMYEYSVQKADSGLGRLQALGFVHNNISKNLLTYVAGYGPGAITPTRFLGRNTNTFYQENDVLLHYNDYAYVTLELGYGGLLLYLYLLYRLFMFNQAFHMRCNDKFWLAVSLGLAGIIFTSIYSIIYARGWTSPPLAFSLWFLAGAITRVAYLRGLLTNPNVSSAIRLRRSTL